MLGLGSGSQPTTECGIFGSYQCLELDGNSDYVTLPAGFMAAFNPSSGTISCWVDIRSNDGATSQNIIRIGNDSSNNNISLMYHKGNTEWRAVYRSNGTYKEATYNDASLSHDDYMVQGWLHFVMTWYSDGAGTGYVKLYKDGVLLEEVSQTANWDGNHNIDVAVIGSNDDLGGSFVDGFIDQLAIWTEPLNVNAVTAIYNLGTPNDLTTTHSRSAELSYSDVFGTLIGYYQFEGNALDSSSYGFHGTLGGTAGFNSTQP